MKKSTKKTILINGLGVLYTTAWTVILIPSASEWHLLSMVSVSVGLIALVLQIHWFIELLEDKK